MYQFATCSLKHFVVIWNWAIFLKSIAISVSVLQRKERRRTTKRRIIASALVSIIAFSFIVFPVSAEEAQLTAATISRVKSEVLSGNLTNQQDVLRVAWNEYQTRKARASTFQETAMSNVPDSFTITQVVDTVIDSETMSTKSLIASTALIVVDENLNQVTPSRVANLVTQDDHISFITYDVYATHTAYFWSETSGDLLDDIEITMQRMTTQIFYQSSTTVITTLQHKYRYFEGPLPYDESDDIIYQPVNRQVYGWQPSHRDPFVIGYSGGFYTMAEVTCNGQTMTAVCSVGVG